MSKGDKPRPLSIPYKEYTDRYENIFGKKDTEGILDLTEEEEIEAERRMDIIGKNGNDGLHYEEQDEES